jgi:hypothetical protein
MAGEVVAAAAASSDTVVEAAEAEGEAVRRLW